MVTSASHGISGKDSVRIANGSYTITSGKDGIHAENTDDSSKGFVYLAGGTFDIASNRMESAPVRGYRQTMVLIRF